MRRTMYCVAMGVLFLLLNSVLAQSSRQDSVDQTVKRFLQSHKNQWHDLNVPESDGEELYDLIIKNKYKRGLEIGTSTGRSAIWISWAMSKTGGKLTTIEINEGRYKKALENFKIAGLSEYIDARLADAHELVPKLKGPFDFVFVDADKDWYKKYAELLLPKLKARGCFTAHNVLNTYMRGIPEFVEYINNNPDLETSIIRSSSSGISVSYKKSKGE